MKIYFIYSILFVLVFISCGRKGEYEGVAFDREKWSYKEGRDYPHRQGMYEELLYSEELRKIDKEEILDLLGTPDRQNGNHIYYLVEEKRMGNIVLHTRFLVFLFTDSGEVEWIKLHE